MFSIPSGCVNAAALTPSTYALGPGERAVLWMQGCPFRCTGCIAPDWLPFREACLVPVEVLVEDLLASPTIRGLTFSGGEPMLQAKALADVVRLARTRRELDLITFTGYRYGQLVRQPPESGIPELLAQTDVLVEGPYVRARNNGLGLRGSSNQRILHLTSRLKSFDLERCPRQVEIQLHNREALLIGIPSASVHASWEQAIVFPGEIGRLTHERD